MTIAALPTWDGDPLPDGPIAMLSVTPERGADADLPGQSAVSVAAAMSPAVAISRDQLARFLESHADRVIVCVDAAGLHWDLFDQLSASTGGEGLSALWSVSRQAWLHDVALFDQRLHLAQTGRHIKARTLEEIARERCQRKLLPDSGIADRLASLLAVYDVLSRGAQEALAAAIGVDPTEGESGHPDSSRQAERVWKRARWEVLRGRARDFGPLGLGLDVQGAIAGKSASRQGIQFDLETVEGLRWNANQLLEQSSAALYKDEKAKKCFHWDGPNIRRDGKGYLAARRDALCKWLAKLLGGDRDLHNHPRALPRDHGGGLLTLPDCWDLPADCQPLLRAYVDLEAAAATERFLRGQGRDGRLTVQPRYEMVPRIRSVSPALKPFARFSWQPFVPRPGRTFVVCRLRDIALRCFALGQWDWFGERSELFNGFINVNKTVQPQIVHLRENEWFRRLDEQDQAAASQVLLHAAMRDLSIRETANLLTATLRFGVTPVEVDAFLTEFRTHYRASVCPVFHAAFTSVYGAAQPSVEIPFTDEAVVERYLTDSGAPSPAVVPKAWLSANHVISVTGRVGRSICQGEFGAVAALELADEVRKAVAYALVAAGFSLVAIAEDELVAEIAGDAPSRVDDELLSVVDAAARRLLGPVEGGCCECQRQDCWSPRNEFWDSRNHT